MTILRSGATDKYSANWSSAFGDSKKPVGKKKSAVKKKPAAKSKKKTAKK